jgi:exosortase
MSSAAKPTSKSAQSETYIVRGVEWGIVIPYAIAILSQFPMLYLYYNRLMDEQHYQSVLFGVAATIVLSVIRWPRNQALQFHSSYTSNTLFVLGLFAVGFSVLFVEPWMSALSVMLIVTSFLCRVYDEEANSSLWYAALPMYVFLALPFGMDRSLITSLQYYAAIYTSRLLDLAGVGHHMNGVVIDVPNMDQYQIEAACSGVQSFFTLVLVAIVYSAFTRQIKSPSTGVSVLSALVGFICIFARILPRTWGGELPSFWSILLLIAGVAFLLYAIIGFRTTALVLSAVFWALFMNTVRILAIPLTQFFLDYDLSHGNSHTLLGYSTLLAGIVLIISSDHFLLFLFGPVEDASDSGPFGRIIGRMWNSLTHSNNSDSSRSKRRSSRKPVSPLMQKVLWGFAGIMIVAGLWQIRDVSASMSARENQTVRAFDGDVTVEFDEGDAPQQLENWTRVSFKTEKRTRGSDFGERSDVWQYRAPTCTAIAALDQTFPGWHELTTCYRNSGWTVVNRKALSPAKALGLDPSEVEDNKWGLIEVTMKKPTGERAYLLFSHFDSFGNGLAVPGKWGTVNGFITRVLNRLSHRIRASLLQGEAYQVQVLLRSYNDFDPAVVAEARKRYLKLRSEVRNRFLEKASVPEA